MFEWETGGKTGNSSLGTWEELRRLRWVADWEAGGRVKRGPQAHWPQPSQNWGLAGLGPGKPQAVPLSSLSLVPSTGSALRHRPGLLTLIQPKQGLTLLGLSSVLTTMKMSTSLRRCPSNNTTLKMNFWRRPCISVGNSLFLAVMYENDTAWVFPACVTLVSKNGVCGPSND